MDSTILEAVYKYSYTDDQGNLISFNKGERFILLNKASDDWWKVQRTGVFTGKNICYVPASYMKEINITPRGKSGFVNQYVNMEVYRKIVKRDTEGLAKLGNQSMVVSKLNNVEVMRGNDGESGESGESEEEESDDEESEDESEPSLSEDDEADDDAFDPSLDDIPSDLRSFKFTSSSDMSPEPNDRIPSLTFDDVSPRNERMKSFTLPATRSKSRPQENNTRLSTFDKEKRPKLPKKSPRAHAPKIPLISTSPALPITPTPDLPNGWSLEEDPVTKDSIFINNVSKERWKSCPDNTGRTYYYNLDGPGTAWHLPELSDSGRPKNLRRKSFDETLEGVIRRQTMSSSRSPRNQKCQSVMIRSPSSLSSDEGRSTSKSPVISPRLSKEPPELTHNRTTSNQSFEKIYISQITQLEADSVQGPKAEKSGQLIRRKVVEGRKLVKKPVWTPVYVCKYDSNLVFYKDQKSASPKPGFPTGKPESSLDLHGAVLDHISKEKVKGKKFVFQIASYGGQNVHQFVAENQVEMGEWIVCIQATIHRLEEQEPLPSHPQDNVSTVNGPSERVTSPLTLTPDVNSNIQTKLPSPNMPKKLIPSSEKGGFKGFSRKLSKRVTGSSNNDDDSKDKTKIKDKLKKYLSKRPSFNELESKGIISDFVFGYPIEKLCEREDNLVPSHVVKIVYEVERRGLDVDGIYRVSGNLSSVNKLRGLIDNGETVDYKAPEWHDIHLLTGCLKLYFRELPEPLIPYHLFDRFIEAMKSPFKAEKMKLLKTLVGEMIPERRETLNMLVTHFRKVIQHSSQNRMHLQNIAIVFGPTLLWPETESINMAMTTVFQNQVIEFVVQEWDSLYVL